MTDTLGNSVKRRVHSAAEMELCGIGLPLRHPSEALDILDIAIRGNYGTGMQVCYCGARAVLLAGAARVLVGQETDS